jgi:transcription elongation GreA/GreB family factor
MSRAFVKETAESAPPPERMLSEGPNPVTRAGLAKIEAEVSRLEAALAGERNVLLRETLERDLRYWRVVQASAEVVEPSDTGRVGFGSDVTLRRQGRRQRFTIVGEDEADPAQGLINIRSPLAQAILGAEPGDVIEAGKPLGNIEILSVCG